METTTTESRKAEVIIPKPDRFGFIDQFRGVVILLFVVADITWMWSGDIDATTPRIPVGPTWLNHGWKFYNFDPKQIITLIDIGQLLFVFVMGIMIPLTWKLHKEKGGIGHAIGQLLVRLGWFYLIAGVMGDFKIESTFLTGTFAILAASMIAATLAAAIVQDPDKRFHVNVALMVALGVLYAVLGGDSPAQIVPLHLLGASIVAIQGGIFMEWFVRARDKDPDVALKRILKVSLLLWIACFFIDYFYWADHKAMNISLVTMSIGAGGFLFVIFYLFETKFTWTIPGLNPFGRNTLLAFILALPFQILVWDVMDLAGTYNDAPWPIAPLMAIVSIVIFFALYYTVLVPFDRKQWYFTPSIFIRAIKYGMKKKQAKS